jgi:peptidoglycan/LPS O-acetylase OafA/YrhL
MPAAGIRVRRDAPTGDRVAALDALRAVSMVAVVALHASAAYLTVRIPGLIWLVNEPAGSEFVQQFAWWAYGATMPTFFALAGYGAAAALEAKGTRGYVVDRARRIGLTFVAAIPAVLLPTVLIWMLGLYLAGRCGVTELLALSFADGQIHANRFGPAHLWFLAYLIPMLALLGVVPSWCRELQRRWYGKRRHFCSPLAPLMLAIPTTLILWLGHWWNGVDPILDLRNSFLINPIRWLHHSLFFIAGLGWYSGRTRLPALTRGPLPWLFLAGSAVALVVRVRYLPRDLAASLTGSAAWVSVATASLFGWLTLYGSLGVCAFLGRQGGRAIKYLSDSSYWVYLVHFPVVGLVQADLYLVALPSSVKFLIALAIGLAWSLLTYEACVRRTWVGRWLRGGAPRVPLVPRPAYLDRDEVPARTKEVV